MACQHGSCTCAEAPITRDGNTYCSEYCATKAHAPTKGEMGASTRGGCGCAHAECGVAQTSRGTPARGTPTVGTSPKPGSPPETSPAPSRGPSAAVPPPARGDGGGPARETKGPGGQER